MALFSAASRVLFSANYASQCELRANARLPGIVNRNAHNKHKGVHQNSALKSNHINRVARRSCYSIPTDVGIAFWVIFEGLNQKLINTNIICVSTFRVIIDATLIDACAKTVMCAYGLQLLSCIRKKKKRNSNDVANSSNIIAHQRIICQMSPR